MLVQHTSVCFFKNVLSLYFIKKKRRMLTKYKISHDPKIVRTKEKKKTKHSFLGSWRTLKPVNAQSLASKIAGARVTS